MNLFSNFSSGDPLDPRLEPANASLTQKWKLDDKGRIISLFNNKAITRVGTGGATMSAQSDDDGQKFVLGYNSPSYFFLQNMLSGKVMGVENTDATVGAQVNLYDKDTTSGMPFQQLWKFRDGYLFSAVPDSKVSRGESLMLDATNGAPMQLQQLNYSDGQLWNFQFDFTGVSMTNLKNNKLLGGPLTADSDKKKLDFNDNNGLLNQKWWMIKVNDVKGAMVMTIEFDKG
jgi:hypothetical protein